MFACAFAIAAFAVALDLFGLTSAGMGPRQRLLLWGAGAMAAAAVGLHVLVRRGTVHLPEWPLPSDPAADAGVVGLVVWFALLAGLLEPLILHAQNRTGLRFNYVNPHLSWMSPISYFAYLMAVLVIAVALGRGQWRWLRSERAMAALLCGVSLSSLLLLLHPELHVVAIVVLAAGASVQLFRVLASRLERFRRMALRTMVPLASLVLVAAGWTVGVPAVREAIAVAGLPALPAGAPNVLVIILDTVRGANVSFNGYARETTPNLARRAAAGVVFTRAISTSSWSASSHGSLVTGQYPFDLEIDWTTPLSGEHPTLASRLSASGYRTGGFLANKRFGGKHTRLNEGSHHWDVDRVSIPAIAGASMIGLMLIEPRRLALGIGNLNRLASRNAPIITGELIDWLDREPDRPFFAMLNYFDAHAPYNDSPAPFDTLFGPEDRPALPVHERLNAREMARERDGYDRSIAYLDSELERLFEALDERGLLDRTIVIVTSDHGEQFGEKEQVAHGNSLDYAVLHVPLVLWGPGIPAGVRVPEPVSIRDIPETVLDLVPATDGPQLAGSTLRRFWDVDGPPGSSAPHELVFAGVTGRSWLPDDRERQFGNLVAAFEGDLRYGRYGEQADESLFDISRDPWEHENLIDRPDMAGALARFRSATDSIAARYMSRNPNLRN
jgi:arylsulfatase A-like enzyme